MKRVALFAALAAAACGAPTVHVEVPAGSQLLQVPGEHATIQAAVDAARPGDVVLVAPGRHREHVVISRPGITLASRFPGSQKASDVERTEILGIEEQRPVISVTAGTEQATRIVGLTVREGDGGGIDVHGSRVEILDNRVVANREDGLGLLDSQAVVRGNLFAANSDDGIDSDGANSLLIEDNELLRNEQDGIEMRLHDYSGPVLETTVRRNLFRGNREDAIQLIDYAGATDRIIRIERNVFAESQVGIGCMADGATDEDFQGAPLVETVHVVHNTFVRNLYGLTGGDDMAIVNNTFALSFRGGLKRVRGRSVVSHNLFWRNARDASDAPMEADTAVRADPRLDARHRPRSGSAAIDAGATSFVHDGVELVPPGSWSGAAPDLGAFEAEAL